MQIPYLIRGPRTGFEQCNWVVGGWHCWVSVSALDGGSSGHTKYDYSSHSIIYTPGAVSFNSFDYTNDTPVDDGSNYRVEQ